METMMKRRTLIQGTSWTLPTIAMSAAAPAIAASTEQQDPACVAHVPTTLARYMGSHVTLRYEPTVSTVVPRATGASSFVPMSSTIDVPQTLTIANTGTEVLPSGLPIIVTAYSLDEVGIVKPEVETLVLQGATGTNVGGEHREAFVSPLYASPRTTMRLVCPLEPGRQISVHLTWGRQGAVDRHLTKLQFLASVIFDGNQSSYLECQSFEVLGGSA